MSGFVCVLERSGREVKRDHLERLGAGLETYGKGVAIFCQGPVGILVRHDASRGAHDRHGPIQDPLTGAVVAVAGRFTPVSDDDRGGSAGGAYAPAQAALAFVKESVNQTESSVVEAFLKGVSGPFVLAAGNPGTASVEIARDHLGCLKVYYKLDRERLIAASEPTAILRHGLVSRDLDESSITRFLGFRFGLTERSYFQEILELPPACRLSVTGDEAVVRRYWTFPKPPGADPTPEEITAGFRRRLAKAISDDMAGLEPEETGLSLSGGLDSTALAALAPQGIRAFSWTFDEVPEGDERERVQQVCRHLDMPIRWVSGDGSHPLCDGFEHFVDENSPYLNPFAALKQRLYRAALEAGCKRILVGDGGDAHFGASEYWLRDSLFAGQPKALRSFVGTVRNAAFGDRFARRTLGRALLFSRYPKPFRRHPAPWLTPTARRLLGEERRSPHLPPGNQSARHELTVGVKLSELESEEQRLFALCGVERANPFWSWPLLELTIHLSAFWYHSDKRSKVLTREALRGLLPNIVLEGGRGGSLGRFYLHGLATRREELIANVFDRPRSDWQKYVQRRWVEPFLSQLGSITFGHTILWRVVAYELWYRRLVHGQDAVEATFHKRGRGGKSAADANRPTEIAGVVYGVAIRGRVPAAFGDYLLPCGESSAADSLEIEYRHIDKLPEIDAIWESREVAAGASTSGSFAVGLRDDGFDLAVRDQGRGIFRCDSRRIAIEWTAAGTAAPHYFFTGALPLWLETKGVPVLHGSAVLIDGRALGFVGRSGVGKSVLAADLARAGSGLLSDDGLALRRNMGGGWLVFAGPPLLRLWPSALRLLGIPADGLAKVHEPLEKRQFDPGAAWSGPVQTTTDAAAAGVRLAALYILERQPDPTTPPKITRIAPGEALARLIEHSVAAAPAAVLGLSARRFQSLGDVVESIPVRGLCLPNRVGTAGWIREEIIRDLEGLV